MNCVWLSGYPRSWKWLSGTYHRFAIAGHDWKVPFFVTGPSQVNFPGLTDPPRSKISDLTGSAPSPKCLQAFSDEHPAEPKYGSSSTLTLALQQTPPYTEFLALAQPRAQQPPAKARTAAAAPCPAGPAAVPRSSAALGAVTAVPGAAAAPGPAAAPLRPEAVVAARMAELLGPEGAGVRFHLLADMHGPQNTLQYLLVMSSMSARGVQQKVRSSSASTLVKLQSWTPDQVNMVQIEHCPLQSVLVHAPVWILCILWV